MRQSKYTIRVCLSILFFLVVINLFSQGISVVPDPVYFGIIPVGTEGQHYVLLYNNTVQKLNITNLQIMGPNASDFSFVTIPSAVSIPPAGRVEIDLQFYTQTPGSKQAYLIIDSNASTSPDSCKLTAVGVGSGSSITFERIFGHPDSDHARTVRITKNGGYIIAGSYQDINKDWSDASLIKTDKYGQVEWIKTYGSEDNEESFNSLLVVDDGYIAVGSKAAIDNVDENVYIVKTDIYGDIVWTKNYGGTDDDAANVIEAAGSGRYIIAGFTKSAVYGTKRAYLIVIDNKGNKIRDNSYADCEEATSVQSTSDGGYVFCGSTRSISAGESDFYLGRTDSLLNKEWEKAFGGSDCDEANYVINTSDGGFILAGWTASPEFGAEATDVYLVKTDASGNQDMQWGNRVYGGAHHDHGNAVIQTTDGGYLIVGYTQNNYDAERIQWTDDVYIIKCDNAGNKLWEQTYGGFYGESASSVQETPEGDFIICGNTGSYSKRPGSDVYLLRLNNQGIITSVKTVQSAVPKDYILTQNSPNPFNNATVIKYRLPKTSYVNLSLYNIRGQKVRILVNGVKQAGFHTLFVNGDDLPSGLYFYRIEAGNFIETKRMLLLK